MKGKQNIVKFVYPVNRTTESEAILLKEALNNYDWYIDEFEDSAVPECFNVDIKVAADGYQRLCRFSADGIRALYSKSDPKLTITYDNYAVDPMVRLNQRKFLEDVAAVRQIEI